MKVKVKCDLCMLSEMSPTDYFETMEHVLKINFDGPRSPFLLEAQVHLCVFSCLENVRLASILIVGYGVTENNLWIKYGQ
jgi:hypothetical protein